MPVVRCVHSNLHVVSVGSVDQLQQFVKSLPELLSGPLRCCRVVFVDDLDLGMAICGPPFKSCIADPIVFV